MKCLFILNRRSGRVSWKAFLLLSLIFFDLVCSWLKRILINLVCIKMLLPYFSVFYTPALQDVCLIFLHILMILIVAELGQIERGIFGIGLLIRVLNLTPIVSKFLFKLSKEKMTFVSPILLVTWLLLPVRRVRWLI